MSRRILLVGLAPEVGEWLTEALEVEVLVAEPHRAEAIARAAPPSLAIATDPGHRAEVEPLLSRLRKESRIPVLFCLDPVRDAELARRLIADGLADELLMLPLDRSALVAAAARLSGARPKAQPAATSQLASGVAALWERFREQILARVAVLERAGVALLDGSLEDDMRREAAREAHRLVGSAGTFGIPAASRTARELESLLERDAPLGPEDVHRMAELVVRLRDLLEAGPETVAAPPGAAAATRLLVAGDDDGFAARLVEVAASRGMAGSATPLLEAIGRLDAMRPDIIVILGGGENEASLGAWMALLDALAGVDPPIPAVIVSSSESLQARLAAARIGVRAFLQGPLPAEQVVEECERVLDSARPTAWRIAAVDDDAEMLATLRALLGDHGYEVDTYPDALELIPALSESVPDLLILDVDLPHLSGVEICRVLRADPRWQALPVLMLTASRDPDLLSRAFVAGADDFVLKPVVPQGLVARIHNRLERVRLYRRLAETDHLTGLPNRRRAETMIDQLRRLADRYRQPLSLAVLDLDRFHLINERHGHDGGDRVLRAVADQLARSFRGEDVVARWGGEEFVIAMYGMRSVDAIGRLQQVLAEFRGRPATSAEGGSIEASFSAGVAQLGVDGESFESLLAAADRALFTAKRDGRARIAGATAQGGQASTRSDARLDVLVVEDDEPLAQLLLHALHGRGLRAEWIADGYDALRSLDPRSGSPGARVVLLDVDLPGMDGLALLRRLHQLGTTGESRFVMLTARANEPEVLEALRTGAFDHVAKPFSLPVLMERVARALEG